MFKIYLTALFISLSILSCEKDVLNIENVNQPTQDQFWKSESDAELGVNAIYHSIYSDGAWRRWIFFRYNLSSDEGYSQSPWTELADWTKFLYTNYNFWEGNSCIWRDHYKAIFRCNQVLDNIPSIEFADPNKKLTILGQAKFLRAFYYYDLVSLWGNIPLVLKSSQPSDKYPTTIADSVWLQIKKDLIEASDVLPEKWNNDNLGRPTKGAALGLLARAEMQTHNWKSAKDALDWLVTGDGKKYYGLTTNWRDNFTALNENNIESVFEIQFSNVNINTPGDIVNPNIGIEIGQFFAPRGIGWSDGQGRYWIVNEFRKELTINGKIDPRLQYTFFYKDCAIDFPEDKLIYGKDWTKGEKANNWGKRGGTDGNECWYRKFARDYEPTRTGEDYYSEINFRYLRYADILLMYAECLNELGQTANAYQYVNLVRARVKMKTLESAYPEIGTSVTLFRERMKMERLFELTGECTRWNDLKRWGELESQEGINKLTARDPDFKNFVVGKSHYLPIPQSEIDADPLLKQNLAY